MLTIPSNEKNSPSRGRDDAVRDDSIFEVKETNFSVS
jgi:hypothetical protein